MRIDIVTIFPEYLAPLELSLIGRARRRGLIDLRVHDLRQWTHDVHRTVDDTPYGGGPGMVMRPEPWGEALDALLALEPGGSPEVARQAEVGEPARLVVPSAAGQRLTQAMAHHLAATSRLIFACGRYEGIDQRVLDAAAEKVPVDEVCLGDYVTFGGEVAVLVIVEAVLRLVPGVLGNALSLVEESHAQGLLEAPVYTKPPIWRGREVPDVLRSGDHERIRRWQRSQSLLRTLARRPDLLASLRHRLDQPDQALLQRAGFQLPSPGVAE